MSTIRVVELWPIEEVGDGLTYEEREQQHEKREQQRRRMAETDTNGECFLPDAKFYAKTCLRCSNCPPDMQWCPLFRAADDGPRIELRIIDGERSCTEFRTLENDRSGQLVLMI
jgi:hypothetical protein